MVYAEYTMDTEMIEEKIGEVLGLEMAAQKAVDQLVTDKVKSILSEEKEHLQECIKLARENIK